MSQTFQETKPVKRFNQNKGADGKRASHQQMERNFHNDRDKSDVKGASTTGPKDHS